MTSFGKIIVQARKKLAISQKELAQRIYKEDGTPITAQYLNDIEHDRRHPPHEAMLKQLAQELQINEVYLCLIAGTIPTEMQQEIIAAGPEKVDEVVQLFRKSLQKKAP